MEALVSCFSSSTTMGTESWPCHISQPIAYRREAKEAARLLVAAECHSQTRLITRVRMHYRWLSPTILFSLLVEFIDIIMMRKCMLGIKQRAERASRQTPEPIGTTGSSMPGSSEFVAQEMQGA